MLTPQLHQLTAAQEPHLRDYLRVIRKRRYSVLTFLLIAFALVSVATFSMRPVYKATSKLLIEKAERVTFDEYGFTPFDPQFYATHYQLIKSRPVALRVMKALEDNPVFMAYYSEDAGFFERFMETFRSALDSFFGALSGHPAQEPMDPEASRRELIVDAILRNIAVRPVPDTRIVEVSFLSRNPELARLAANTVANAYIEALFELRMDSAEHAMGWMARKLDDERGKLEESENLLQRYMREHDIVTLEDRVTIIPQKLSEISTQLTKAGTRRKEIETLYQKVQSLRSAGRNLESLPVVDGDRTVSALRTEILKAEQQITEFSRKYGSKHPVMIEAQGNLRALREKKDHEVSRVVEAIRNEYDLALSNERNLQRLLAETKMEAHTVNEKFIQYGVLKRDVETNRQMFESLLKRMREESVNEEVQSVKVMLVESAERPDRPERRKTLNLAVGLLGGLLGGILLAFFLEYFDVTVRSAEDAEARLGMPVLGMVSHLRRGKDEEKRNIERIVLDEPRSTFAESYKALRTAIMLSSAEAPPRTLLVTSMGLEEGKTSTSVNLSLAIAQSMGKVLLVDTDLRKPRIHTIFGISNKTGLTSYLSGAEMKVIKESPLPNLNIITSGPIPPNPSELLGSEKFAKFIALMRERYDMIVFDSPPVMSVTDALVLSRQMDGTVIVARAGKTTYEVIGKGVKQLRDVGSRPLGLLINAIDARKGGYYYNYYYYHNYQYYSSPEEPQKPLKPE